MPMSFKTSLMDLRFNRKKRPPSRLVQMKCWKMVCHSHCRFRHVYKIKSCNVLSSRNSIVAGFRVRDLGLGA